MSLSIGSVMQADLKPAPGAEPRVVKAARDFEAMMLKELLAPLMTGSEEDDSGSEGALRGFAAESLGRSLSISGGFGIADRLVATLSHSGNGSKSAPVTAQPHNKNRVEPSQ